MKGKTHANVKRYAMLRALSSLKLTVALLLFIAGLCLVGSVFPQEAGTEAAMHAPAPRIPSLITPYDIFHSIWFVGAGILLCINLLLCMVGNRPDLRRKNLVLLLLHGGILLVIAGYAMGTLGIEGFMEIPEGRSISTAVLKTGDEKDLGFSVRCDRFTIDYYKNGMPREYISDLSFLKDGRPASRARLRVNHPAGFEGLSFYQESFRPSLSALVTVADGRGKRLFKLAQGEDLPLSQAGTRIYVVKVWSDLMHAGPAVKFLINDPSGDRYLWVFKDINMIKARIPGLIGMLPEFDPSGFPPYTFTLDNLEASYITGIGVKRDPGAPVAAAGGVLFLIGLVLLTMTGRTSPGSRPDPADTPGMQIGSAGKVPARCKQGKEERI